MCSPSAIFKCGSARRGVVSRRVSTILFEALRCDSRRHGPMVHSAIRARVIGGSRCVGKLMCCMAIQSAVSSYLRANTGLTVHVAVVAAFYQCHLASIQRGAPSHAVIALFQRPLLSRQLSIFTSWTSYSQSAAAHITATVQRTILRFFMTDAGSQQARYIFSVSPVFGCHFMRRFSIRPTSISSTSANPVNTSMPAKTVLISKLPSAWRIR